jgi:hypothetical protein
MGRRGGHVIALAVMLALAGQTARADDLTGKNRFLCASVEATECLDGGACATDLPWNFNIPDFIEVDLDAMLLSTTEESGQNRTTPIGHLSREDGSIFLQGAEMGRGFTFVIAEPTGEVTVAIAFPGGAVIVFGVCTTMDHDSASERKESTP